MSSAKAPYTFVTCVVEKWKSPWLCHQPLTAEFLKNGHNVFYSLNEHSFDDVKANLARPSLEPSGLEKIAERHYELVPSKLYPRFYFSERLNRFSASLRARELRGHLDRLGWGNRIHYLWHPFFAPMIGKVGARLTVFDAHDHYPGFCPEGSHERAEMERLYDEAIRRSDVVIACGQALFDDIAVRRGTREGVHLIENGVQFDKLSSAGTGTVPPELRDLPKPVIAYVGRINTSVNFDVLESIAKAKPWTLVVIGPKTGWADSYERRFQKFLALPNVRYIGGRTGDAMADCLRAIDLGLITYQRDGIMPFRFPLKMLEYFANGKAVASVDLSSIRKFEPCVRLVPDDSKWVQTIEKALAEDDDALRLRRQEIARSYDWKNKADETIQVIESALGERSAEPHGRLSAVGGI